MGENPNDEVNELLEGARKLNKEIKETELLIYSRERRFYRAFLVTLDEQQYLYAVCFAAPMSDPVSARSVIQNAMLVSDYFNDIWITEDSKGNLIGYGTKEVMTYQASTRIFPSEHDLGFEVIFVNVPRESEAEYEEALDKLRRDGIIVELTDLIIEEVEYLYQLGKVARDGLREIEEKRLEAIKEQVPSTQATLYTTQWWEVLKKDAEVYGMLKKGVKDDEQAKQIMSIALSVASMVAAVAIPASAGAAAALISVALAGASIAVTASGMNTWTRDNLDRLHVNVQVSKFLSWYNPQDPLGNAEIVKSFYGGYESYREAQKVFQGLILDYSALEIRNYQIEYFLPRVVALAIDSYYPKGCEIFNTWSWEKQEEYIGPVPFEDRPFAKANLAAAGGLMNYINDLFDILFKQPNSLIMTYQLAKEYLPDIFTDEEKHRELKSVLSEYVDQSHWRLVSDDRAIHAWANVLNLTPGQFKLIAPDEDFIRLKKVTYHPLITRLKEYINFYTEGDPGTAWLLNYSQKMSSESKELGLGGGISEEPIDASVLAATGYGVTQGVTAASYTRGTDYSRGEVEVSSAPSIPTTGYGAGFLGMPSGGGGKAESSSLSLPPFPSVSLPSLGGGPSALPSPVGLGGVGGVPSTPSVGLPGLGWDGAAMPAMGAASPMGMPGGPAIPSSAPSAPVSAQGGPSGGGARLDFPSLFGGSQKSMIAGSQGFAGTETAEAGQSLSRAEKLVDRLMQIPDMLAMAESSPMGPLGSSGKSAGDVSQRIQPQQPVRMVINRHEEISKEKLEQYVTAWLESQSRVG